VSPSADDDRWRHLAPIHSWRTTATVVLVAVPLIAIGALLIRGNASADLPDIKPPKGASAATLPPPTTLPASLAGIGLPAVDGTTTVPPVRLVGDAKLGGTVTGPSGPLPGAIVHVERVNGGYTNDFLTGADAKYLFGGLPGGRYRLRAFLAPTYAQTQSDTVFVGADEAQVVDLKVEQFDQLAVTSALAPDPPVVGQSFNLVVRVAKRTVDAGGVVRSAPLAGASVVLSSTGTLILNAPAAGTTGADGTVTYLSGCKGPGALAVTATVRAKAADPPQNITLDLSACEAPATTTTVPGATTTTTSTTAKPAN
jgi:hypothetical protein